MNIPSKKECFQLMQKMKMMDHIVDHSIMVANVTSFLCHSLKKQFPNINTKIAVAAALLHDITKTRSFKTNEVHSITGDILLQQLGYPKVGNIVRQHVMLDIYKNKGKIFEQEIVNYSDKKVKR